MLNREVEFKGKDSYILSLVAILCGVYCFLSNLDCRKYNIFLLQELRALKVVIMLFSVCESLVCMSPFPERFPQAKGHTNSVGIV